MTHEVATEDASVRISRDALWGGRAVLWQPARGCGYRFNLDSLLLWGFAKTTLGQAPEGGHWLDFGAGCGIVGILSLLGGQADRVTAVEVQAHLAYCCRQNVLDNQLTEVMQVVEGDVRQASVDVANVVIFNPPYFAAGQGRKSPEAGRDGGRVERQGTLRDFVAIAQTNLVDGGWMFAIVPSQRGKELVNACRVAGLTPKLRRLVYARKSGPAKTMLLCARKLTNLGREECLTMPHLILHGMEGRNYTPEVEAWVQGPPAASLACKS